LILCPEKNEIYNNIKKKNKQLNSYLYVEDSDNLKSATGSLSNYYVGVKDNICVKNMPLTNGSEIFKDYTCSYDATVVKRLKAAGASIIGKLNLDEFSMGSGNIYSAFGSTKNPLDITRTTGGSSGGSASAVAAGMASFSIGSDSGGSIRQPAAYCGVYGYKPTYGVLSRYGLTSFASSLDHIGLISSKPDMFIDIIKAISGKDVNDATSLEAPVFKKNSPDISEMKIGVIAEYDRGLKPYVKDVYENAKSFFRKKGAEIVELSFPDFDKAISVYQVISTAEASSNLARFAGVKYTRGESGEDFYESAALSRSAFFGDEVIRRILLGTYVLSGKCFDSYYLQAEKVRTLIYEKWCQMFKEVNYILTPVTKDIAFKLDETPPPHLLYSEDVYTVPANLTHMPAISFPAGAYSKMPVGLQLIAPRMKDSDLINMVTLIENEHYSVRDLDGEISYGRV